MTYPAAEDLDLRPLVQAPMESPLNWAHTFSRKAEMLTKSKHFDEAISCYSKASECLLIAMKSCTSQALIDSMSLQHKAYLSQMDRLSTKTHLLDLRDSSHKTTATTSRSTQVDCVENVCGEQCIRVDEDSIYEMLRENEVLLSEFMKLSDRKATNQTSERSDTSYKSINLSESSSSDGLGDDRSKNGRKLSGSIMQCSCDANNKIDSVLQMNQKLSQCVTNLLQELSSTHAEKIQIEERLSELDDSFTRSQIANTPLKFATLHFPPIELLHRETGSYHAQSGNLDSL